MALAFSGGAANELASFHASPLVDGSDDAHPDAYTRMDNRPAPFNLVVNLATLSRQVASAAPVRDVGFHWGASDPQSAQAPRASHLTATVGNTPVSFEWNAAVGRWVETVGGSPVLDMAGAPVSTRDVLVQFCQVTLDYHDIDQAGNPAAYTHSLGSGKAVLFRDGRRIDGTWTRRHLTDPTSFQVAGGQDLLLHPGGVWVLLAAAGSPLNTG